MRASKYPTTLRFAMAVMKQRKMNAKNHDMVFEASSCYAVNDCEMQTTKNQRASFRV